MKKGKMKRTLFALLFMPALLLTASSVWAEQKGVPESKKYGVTLVIGVDREPRSIDPRYLGGNWRERPGYQQVFDRLVEYGPSGVKELRPMLATSWKKVDDVTWLIQLRKGVKLHSGREVTAEDIKAQIDWALVTPKDWKPLRTKEYVRPLEKVEAVDRYTLKMTLKTPNYVLFEPFVLVRGFRGLGDTEQLVKAGVRPVKEPIGSGPFKMVEWVAGDHITIERNEQYWGKKPYLDRVIFRIIPDNQTRILALQKGEIDIATLLSMQSAPVVQKDPHINLVKVVRVRMGGVIYFNLRRWPMNQVKFRQAVAMGAEWEKLAKVAHPYGLGIIRRTYLEDSWAYNPSAGKLVLTYNLQKARKLIAEVEAEAGKKIPPLSTIFMKEEVGYDFMQMAYSELKRNLGINLDMQVMQYAVFQNARRSDPKMSWDIMHGGGIGPEIDPHMVFQYYQSDSGKAIDGSNEVGYKNSKVDQLIQQGLATMDRKKRTVIYQEMEKILLQDVPSIPVYNTPNLFGISKRVHDFKPHNSAEVFLNSSWNNIWVDKK
jgi:peptide/nickel transport system substrate-binding protein